MPTTARAAPLLTVVNRSASEVANHIEMQSACFSVCVFGTGCSVQNLWSFGTSLRTDIVLKVSLVCFSAVCVFFLLLLLTVEGLKKMMRS